MFSLCVLGLTKYTQEKSLAEPSGVYASPFAHGVRLVCAECLHTV